MSKLKDLVPPLELCKQIPQGKFDDSALVWAHNGGMVVERTPDAVTLGRPPAPTLAEILEKLRKMRHFPVLYFDAYKFQRWTVEDMCGSVTCDQSNPATAALRLWLEVNGVEVEK